MKLSRKQPLKNTLRNTNNKNKLKNYRVMKLTNLILSASVAAMALVACNKQETTPQTGSSTLKTVEVSLENVIFTKGVAGPKVNDGDKVIVNTFQIFLTDASGNEYTGKTSTGAEAKSYWDQTDLAGGIPATADFHFVDPNCTKVVAVANYDQPFASYAEFLTASQSPLLIDKQQDHTNLVLYDESTNFTKIQSHDDTATDANGNPVTYTSDVYSVELVLTPRVSRFEVDGFAVKFNATPKYQEIKISQLAFQNYYPETHAVTGVETGVPVNHIADLSMQAAVYAWLNDTSKQADWYWDACDLTITPSSPAKNFPDDLADDTDGPRAYHIFSCDGTVPQFVIALTADGQPAYLYTRNFNDENGDPVTEFEEGKIYRMSGEGEVAGKGAIEIPEDKIDPMDRCLDIKVEVKQWEVALITPEF